MRLFNPAYAAAELVRAERSRAALLAFAKAGGSVTPEQTIEAERLVRDAERVLLLALDRANLPSEGSHERAT